MILRLISLSALVCLLVGCSGAQPGTVRILGPVEYDQAFAASRSTLSQFSFSVMEADKDSGVILSRPTYVDHEQRLVGNTPTRRIARMKLTQGRDGVTARLAIEVQQEVTTVYNDTATFGLTNTYSGVPNDTPAQSSGVTTAEQNTRWRKIRHDTSLETTILNEIEKILGEKKTEE